MRTDRPFLIWLSGVILLFSASGCACFVSDEPLYREGATPGDIGTFPGGCREVEVTAGKAFDDAAFHRIFPNLKARGVRALNLSGTEVTDESLERMRELRTLRWLNVEGTLVTPDAIARLRSTNPDLEIVR